MIRNPIHKVLSTFQSCNVQYLLMGGQACILYGAAEFSRDTDLAILATEKNLCDVLSALNELKAEPIFLPPLELDYLWRGHACHFRCRHPECDGLRVDLMSRMRGCDEFHVLWARRSSFELGNGLSVNVLSLSDLVQSKKTQRDKDWPMIRRLVETDYWARQDDADEEAIRWWLAESRTPSHLLALGEDYMDEADKVPQRPWLASALAQGEDALQEELDREERKIRERDRDHWKVLRKELEEMRHKEAQRRSG